jgi:hypothetical protein
MADHNSSIQPRLQVLRCFGFVGQELLQLVCADPVVLTLSTSSLQRKWQYLTECMAAGKQQVLQECPMYFSKALVTVIAPRFSYVLERGMEGRFSSQAQEQQEREQPVRSEQLLAWGAIEQLQGDGSQGQQQQERQPEQLKLPCGQTLGFGEQQAGFGQQLHLGKLLDPSIPEFLQVMGQTDAADYEAHVQRWVQTEGLKWTAARVT